MKQWIKDQFFYILNIIQFRYFRYVANRNHQLTGKRYFITGNLMKGFIDFKH